jgi:hypothetical protein
MASISEQNRMSKQEAVQVLNEIMRDCIMPKYIALEASNPDAPPEKQSCNLRIGKSFDDATWICLKQIIRKHNLSMKETGTDILIYREQV